MRIVYTTAVKKNCFISEKNKEIRNFRHICDHNSIILISGEISIRGKMFA